MLYRLRVCQNLKVAIEVQVGGGSYLVKLSTRPHDVDRSDCVGRLNCLLKVIFRTVYPWVICTRGSVLLRGKVKGQSEGRHGLFALDTV